MNNILSKVFIFVAGAAIGSVATWKLLEKRNEQIIQQEVDEFKEYWSNKESVTTSGYVTTDDTESESNDSVTYTNNDKDKYKEKLSELEYTKEEKKGGLEKMSYYDKPYVIRPDEFGELDDYDTISLTYYADKVLTDENDEPIDDIDDIVGLDSLETFGEYEDDSVFVRNDRMRVDYEILLDMRNFSDLNGTDSSPVDYE